MNSGEIDRFPVSQLQARYGDLARSAVYKRLDDLGIKPQRVGKRSYISQQQLALLDEVHAFINQGNSMAEFLEMRGLGKKPSSPNGQELAASNRDIMGLFAAVAAQISPSNPLDYLEQLEQACQQRWVLSSSEVAALLKISPQQLEDYPQGFTEAGFIFKPAGRRFNGEPGWRLEKYRGEHPRF